MVTIYGPVRIHGFYERLRDEFDFDLHKLALAERMDHWKYLSQEESLKAMLFSPEDLAPLVEKYAALKLLSLCQGPQNQVEKMDLHL